MTDEEIRALVDAFRQRADADPEIRSVMRKIRNQDADFSDTSRMFWRRSELLRDYLQGVVLDLPAGAREQLCTALLNAGYNETNKVMQSVQQALDEPQGIHLNPVLPKRPAERIHTVAHALEDPTIPDDKIVRRAGAPVANVNMSFHDKYIEENARIRAKLGMKPTITRYGSGCCKWCSEVAGRYRFGEQPDGIFRRHDNCDCVIIYDNQVLRGRETSSGRSKTWEEVKPEDVLAEGFSPKVFSQEEARELQERLMQGLTLAGKRDIMNAREPVGLSYIEPAANNQHELLHKTKRFNRILDELSSRSSKWSGDISLVSESDLPTAYGEKKWNCSISIRDDAGEKTIIHELLHSRSCSYFSVSEYRNCRAIEETSVELYSQEICKKLNIPYSESYPLYVGYLKDINRIAKIENNDFDFARKLFEVDMTKRHAWLCDRVSEDLQNGQVSLIDKMTIETYLHDLEGMGDLA